MILLDTERELLVESACRAAGRGAGDLLFVAGSITDGLANRGSDIDLYVIGDMEVAGSETAARRHERTATIGYHDGREVNLAVLNPAGLAQLKQSFAASVASLRDPRGIAQLVDEDDLKLLHRLRTGEALQGAAELTRLQAEFEVGHLSAYLFAMSVIAAVNRLTDVAGELADGHHESAAWMHREALVHSGQALLASTGVTTPSTKWLVRLLRRDGGSNTGFRDHVVDGLLGRSDDLTAALERTRAGLAWLIDTAGTQTSPYIRTISRRKLD
jgi:nucleotidyltransferase-like protein